MILRIDNTIIEFKNGAISTTDNLLKKQVNDLLSIVDASPEKGNNLLSLIEAVFESVEVVEGLKNVVY